MDPKVVADLLRLGLAALTAVREWRKNASAEQLKALVDSIHAGGGSVGLAAVDMVLDGVELSQANLEAQIRAAGG